MPGWHQATRKWVKDGKLVILGVTQEQHPDRCRLFAQWQKFDWPILHDPINVLEPHGVPITIAIDEHGVVRSTRPRIETFEEEFLNRTFPRPEIPIKPTGTPRPDLRRALRSARALNSATAWRHAGDMLTLWGGPKRINEAIQAYQKAVELSPKDGNALFRLGVCYRMRHETKGRQPDDFQQAVAYWGRALAINPNQYIWRRRIQQYGPRLDKPYSFYDWVTTAQREVAARGEKPIPLTVQPYGAEIAYPAREFSPASGQTKSPDPQGRINRDKAGLIRAEVTVVPAEVRPGQTARVHVTFLPNAKRKAYWNNEAEALRLWIEPPAGWTLSQRLLTGKQGRQAETNEIRRLDFELQVPKTATGSATLRAYALYYVCEGVDGTCLFLRQDIPIEIRLAR